VKIALAQINPTVADFHGNVQKILDFTRRAAASGAHLAVFPELAVCGYPPADLLEKPSFVARCEEAIALIAQATASLPIAVLCGYVTPAPHGSGKHVMNSAALLSEGHVEFVQSKMLLPFYDVFDEQRYFAPARHQQICHFRSQSVAITICEDAWNDKSFWEHRRYSVDPIEELTRHGASVILNLSASPYWRGKRTTRQHMLANIARQHRLPVVMVNQVGGNDSLVFDGTSIALAPDGRVCAQAKSFEEDLVFFDTETLQGDLHAVTGPSEDDKTAALLDALILGTRDYVRKCGFSRVVVGLSGGIDSALVAAIAVRALGAENVHGYGMPSEFSSHGSIEDSRALAKNLGIGFDVLPIHGLYEKYLETLAPVFADTKPDVTEENIQSRIRGGLLMAVSNKRNALVLTTGNKSEMSTGYCTLYGDMVGALAVIGDVVKTQVYALCRYLNREHEIIPHAILDKPPSAELRPDQKDTDTLLPYDQLDPIVEAYVERYESAERIAASQGIDLATVRTVIRMIERAEYKRQQAAPVLKVTPKAFGLGRRFPIAVKVEV
jgi:NAD+ synthase/NAD+ synthase (glutamine-hydrolysing)